MGNGGWHKHRGGKSPVDGGVRVDVIFRDSPAQSGILARLIIWPNAPSEYPQGSRLYGLVPDAYNDVIKWRLSEDPTHAD